MLISVSPPAGWCWCVQARPQARAAARARGGDALAHRVSGHPLSCVTRQLRTEYPNRCIAIGMAAGGGTAARFNGVGPPRKSRPPCQQPVRRCTHRKSALRSASRAPSLLPSPRDQQKSKCRVNAFRCNLIRSGLFFEWPAVPEMHQVACGDRPPDSSPPPTVARGPRGVRSGGLYRLHTRTHTGWAPNASAPGHAHPGNRHGRQERASSCGGGCAAPLSCGCTRQGGGPRGGRRGERVRCAHMRCTGGVPRSVKGLWRMGVSKGPLFARRWGALDSGQGGTMLAQRAAPGCRGSL